ncbi:MAG: DUF935 family protein [Planctomycetota bacterium]
MADPALDLTGMGAADLRKIFVKRIMPRSEKFRRFFGRGTDMDCIKEAMRQAEVGIMVGLCDLESETLGLDPHCSAVLGKRFRSVTCLDWDLVPPTGPDVDKVEAELIAQKVRSDFERIPFLSERLYDLLWSNYDGRGVEELFWERSMSGRFPWRICEMRWVHPRRVSFGPRRELRVINPFNLRGDFVADGFAVDEFPGKFIYWQPRLFREYPEREGLAPRMLYWTFFKRFSWRTRMIWTELFGVPWRIITQEAEVAQGSSVEDARDTAENLGQESTAAFDPGMKLDIVQPDGEHADVFRMSHEDVNLEMSKLVLGQTGTTDAVANRAESITMKSEQDIILQADARGLGERVDHFMVQPTTIMNFGESSLPNAPRFVIKAEPPRDMNKEQERADRAVQIGVPVAVKQYREIAGLRKPEDDEQVLVSAGGGGTDAFGNPLGPSTRIQDPGAEPRTNIDDAAASDTIEDRGNDGASARAEDDLVAAIRSGENWELYGLAAAEPLWGTRAQIALTALPPSEEPARVHGSPEFVVDAGAGEGAQTTTQWAKFMTRAVAGQETPEDISASLNTAGLQIDESALQGSVMRQLIRSALLGALDADWEAENDEIVEPPPFEMTRKPHGLGEFPDIVARMDAWRAWEAKRMQQSRIPDFVLRPFAEAIESFLSRNLLTRPAFDRLVGEARRRSFTIAGAAKLDMVRVAHEELGKSLAAGTDLRQFEKLLGERFTSAGWTTLKPSHVQLIYRNGVMSAYASGRNVQMTQPAVLAARPFWQVVTAGDSRVRKEHRALHGKVLRASDPFWARAPLPWSHNCRCRKVSRSARDLERRGFKVVDGSSLTGVPDPGWDGSGLIG